MGKAMFSDDSDYLVAIDSKGKTLVVRTQNGKILYQYDFKIQTGTPTLVAVTKHRDHPYFASYETQDKGTWLALRDIQKSTNTLVLQLRQFSAKSMTLSSRFLLSLGSYQGKMQFRTYDIRDFLQRLTSIYREVDDIGRIFDKFGFDQTSLHSETDTIYDKLGFDCHGTHAITGMLWDENGFFASGSHKDTSTQYDPRGFKQSGEYLDRGLTIDSRGFDIRGIHYRTHSRYDEHDLDCYRQSKPLPGEIIAEPVKPKLEVKPMVTIEVVPAKITPRIEEKEKEEVQIEPKPVSTMPERPKLGFLAAINGGGFNLKKANEESESKAGGGFLAELKNRAKAKDGSEPSKTIAPKPTEPAKKSLPPKGNAQMDELLRVMQHRAKIYKATHGSQEEEKESPNRKAEWD